MTSLLCFQDLQSVASSWERSRWDHSIQVESTGEFRCCRRRQFACRIAALPLSTAVSSGRTDTAADRRRRRVRARWLEVSPARLPAPDKAGRSVPMRRSADARIPAADSRLFRKVLIFENAQYDPFAKRQKSIKFSRSLIGVIIHNLIDNRPHIFHDIIFIAIDDSGFFPGMP